MTIDRRRFLQLGSLGAGLTAGLPALAFGATPIDTAAAAEAVDDRTVRLSGDGLGLNTTQYAALLNRLAEEHVIAADSYTLGGVVEQLEEQFARVLGKERAIFMPTGTLANHMAVRALAGSPSRVIVQEESHFYQDEGDCAQTLSNIVLMPLAAGRATFTADEVQHVIDQTKAGRVVSRVSAISIETPVRRKQGEHFDSGELNKIVALAKREGIRLHLDGARLFLQAAYNRRGRRRLFAAVRHGLRVALQIFQRGVRRDARRPARRHRRHVPHAAHVRRRFVERLAVRRRGAPLSPRLQRSLQPRGENIGRRDSQPGPTRPVRRRARAVRHEPVSCSGARSRSGCVSETPGEEGGPPVRATR